MTTARACASSPATSGASAARSRASPPIRAISTSSCRRASARPCRWRSDRHAFAYVFEGSGTFSGASEPFGVLTEKETPSGETLVRERTGNRSLVVFDTGDEVTVQAGDEGIRFLLVSGKPIEAAGRLVRADRDEHAGRAAAGGRRTAQRHLHQARLNSQGRVAAARIALLPKLWANGARNDRCAPIALCCTALAPPGSLSSNPCLPRSRHSGSQLPLPVAGRPLDLLGLRNGGHHSRLVRAGRDRLGGRADGVRRAAARRHADRADDGRRERPHRPAQHAHRACGQFTPPSPRR